MQMEAVGIASDTYGFGMGVKPNSIPISVAGIVLAHVDKVYPTGTPLTCTKDGILTEMQYSDKVRYPERMVGKFHKEETDPLWNGTVHVDGRHWVKVT